jgi:hypothetical protein
MRLNWLREGSLTTIAGARMIGLNARQLGADERFFL